MERHCPQHEYAVDKVSMQIPQLSEIEAAILKICSVVGTVAPEIIPIQQAGGRILAEPILADRDSPAHDVSAMDGYAIDLNDLQRANAENQEHKPNSGSPLRLSVDGIAYAGKPPLRLVEGKAVQIFTGGCVPSGANCIIRREDTDETDRYETGFVTLSIQPQDLKLGQNIRYCGENIRQGQVVLEAGTEIGTAAMGALATFGSEQVAVRRKLQITLLASGDELQEPGQAVQPWQIRDSNGPTLRTWLSGLPWTSIVGQSRVQDDLPSIKRSIQSAVDASDIVILTGGVSAGDTDFIPQAIVELGGEILFHRLPIRPGKPVLGARIGNKIIFGLPGNPVSTAVTARVIAQPVLETFVGKISPRELRLPLLNADAKTLPLTWFRLIQLAGPGVKLVDSQGSGDLVSMAYSDGFAEIPAGCSGSGPWKVWLW